LIVVVWTKKRRRVQGSLMICITLIFAFPLVWMLLLSFKTDNEIFNSPLALPESFNIDNYIKSFQTLNIGTLYKNTFFVAICTVFITLIVTFMSSYALSRMFFRNERYRRAIKTYFLLGMMIPPFILLFPVYRLSVAMGLYGSFLSLILPYIAGEISFNTLLFTGFFSGLPHEIEEAAIIDGCGLLQLCRYVVLPMATPIITTVFIFNVLHVWNEFPLASVLLSDPSMYTLPLATSFFKGQYTVDYSGIIATNVLIIVPQLIFYGFFQKYIVEGMTAGAVKG
jgi:raffinose/stachyose/melibiose transport system permease protein